MKRGFLIVALACVASGPLMAQQPAKPRPELRRDAAPSVSPGSPTMTPEMWFYQQELNRYEDPKSAVRRKAEYRAAQRQSRLAALRWMGVDPSRPYVSSMSFYSEPSRPLWSLSYDPYTWRMLPSGLSGPSLKNPF